MPAKNDFTFTVSVSQQNFDYKPSKEDGWFKTIQFEPQQLTVNTLLKNALHGKVFCHCFNSNHSDGSFGMPKKENFISTSTLFFDIDNSDKPLDDYIYRLKFKPSFGYTTFSNGEKGYRFRLGYVFSKPIVGADEYVIMYNAVAAANGFENLDKLPCSQVYFGTNPFADYYKSDYVWGSREFDNYRLESTSDTSTTIQETKDISASTTINGDILNDIRNLKFDDFFHKYAPQYYNNYKTSLETPLILDETKMFFRFPKEYYAVKHKTKGGKTDRWKIGSDRKKKMFFTSKIMLHNLPSLTIDNLLFNLLCERAWYYDNTDNKLSNDVLFEIAKNAYTHNYPLKQYKHPAFRVNKPFWQEQGISARQAANHIRGYLHVKEVERYFNPYISIKDNLKVLKDNGVKVSIRTLQRMVTQGDIQIDNKKRNLYIHYLSERREDVTNAIIDMIREDGTRTQQYYADLLNVDLRTIKRYFSDMKGKYIEREGNNRTGRWVVIEPQQQNVPIIEEPFEMTKIS